MVDRWVVSDTHFGHANILTFRADDGTPVRDFTSVQEMDETIIERWNKVVKPNDVVYHLGDVVINKKFIDLIGRCNGSKRLIMGNHDIFDLKIYQPYFTKIAAMRVWHEKNQPRFIMTHVPLHRESLMRFGFNIHGHIHNNKFHNPDPMYMNVCVDSRQDDYYPPMDYTPRNLEEVIDMFKRMN